MILDFLRKIVKPLKQFSHFTFSFLWVILFSFTNAFGADTPFQKVICQNANHCKLYALTKKGPKLVLTGSSKLINSYSFALIDSSSVFGSFDIDCGTSCSYTYIVNYQTGQVSDQLYLIYAVNTDKKVLVLPDPDDQNLQTLLVRPFFCNKGIKLKRDFDPDNANAIQEIKFNPKGNLYLDYLIYPDYKEFKETIPIDYEKITEMCKSNK